MDKESVLKLMDNSYFDKFLEYAASTIDNFYSLEGYTEMSNEMAGETIKVRAEAIAIVNKIFSPFLNFREKREPTKKEIEQAKAKAGL